MSERALISFERPIETFHAARAEEKDGKAVAAVVAEVYGKAVEADEAVVAVLGDWTGRHQKIQG